MTPAMLAVWPLLLPVSIDDVRRFPAWEVAGEQWSLYSQHVANMRWDYEFAYSDPGILDRLGRDIAAAERAYDAWNSLDNAYRALRRIGTEPEYFWNCDGVCQSSWDDWREVAESNLRRVRDAIGPIDYLFGRMPPAFPPGWQHPPRITQGGMSYAPN